MSKAVRIREHLYDEIARLAKEERRSILAQLEVLLEQALRLQPSESISADAQPRDVPSRTIEADAVDPYFRPDPK